MVDNPLKDGQQQGSRGTCQPDSPDTAGRQGKANYPTLKHLLYSSRSDLAAGQCQLQQSPLFKKHEEGTGAA